MIAAGITLALIAAVAHAYAVVLQAREDRRSPDEQAMRAALLIRLAHRSRWLIGTGLNVGGGLAQVAALAFAPIAIVQPMLSTSQLVLLAVARVKLGERVGRQEILAAAAIVAGLSGVVYAAPHQSGAAVTAGRLAPPIALVAGLALIAFLSGRARPSMRLLLVVGAGLAYACADFLAKLVSDAGAAGTWWLAAIWAIALITIGAGAFLEETTALQHRPAVTVAPVIGAIKVPLPVLMALWAGMEPWQGGAASAAILLGGLALNAAGAATLARSDAVSRVSDASRRDDEEHDPLAGGRGAGLEPLVGDAPAVSQR